MASFNFGLLKLADGESGEAAVSVIVSKAKAEAARAKKASADASAESADANGADKEKAAVLKNLYFYKLQHDNAVRNINVELRRSRQVLIKLRGEERKLKEIGKDGRHLIQLSEEQRELRLKQLSEEQRKFRQQQKKLREEEPKLKQKQKEFYLEHGFLPADGEESQVVDHKPEEKVTSDVGSEAQQKPEGQAATPANADAKPSSEKSSTAGTATSNLQDGSGRLTLSSSQKRKKRNAAKKNGGNEVDKAKKQDSSEADVSNKTDKEPLADYPREEEKRQNWFLNTLQSWLLPRWLC